MKKYQLIITLRVIVYALALVLAFLGVSSLASCSASHSVDAVGKTVIITSDTTVITHSGYLFFKK